jgi:hypothetical protein
MKQLLAFIEETIYGLLISLFVAGGILLLIAAIIMISMLFGVT